jgi:hypothetical protein
MNTLTGYSKTFPIKTKYSTYQVYIPLGRFYGDGSIAWEMLDAASHEAIATATVCMQAYERKPKSEHVFIKNYSENEGIYESLLARGIIGEAIEWLDAGYAIKGVAHCPVNFDKLIG